MAEAKEGQEATPQDERSRDDQQPPQAVEARMERGEPFVFLDTRNPQAWGEADTKLPGAVRVPADEVEQHLKDIPRDRAVITYCT
jgi:rhodanese-related sulfurtransferase